jgi:YegS/Rv2252/BmrU family lipid kinase
MIVNLKSRSGYAKVIWKQVKKILSEQNIEYIVYFTEYKGHATKIAKNITLENEQVKLVILGGDGTVNEVIEGIEHLNKVILGYIPTGSSNDFARSLKLPTNPHDAIMNILKPKYFKQIDIGEVITNNTKRRFAVSCGIGFDAAICQEALNSKIKKTLNKLKLGKLTYVGIALKQIALFKKQSAQILIDGVQEVKYNRIYFISSHIHKYEGGGLMLCPEAKYDDGKLDVCVIGDISKWKILLLLPTAFRGKHVKYKDVDIIRCKEIMIKTMQPLPVHVDGESVETQSKIMVKCLVEKVTIIAGNI